jgi:signal peptidase I
VHRSQEAVSACHLLTATARYRCVFVTSQNDGPLLPQPLGTPSRLPVDEAWPNGPTVALSDDDDTGSSLPPISRQASGARAFVDWVVVVTVALVVAFVVRGFVLAHFVVDGQSMATTLDTGDRVFVNKLSYRLHDPNRGDVVVLHQMTNTTERDLIKRVVALPGETIEMTGCVVRITQANVATSQVLDEPYLNERDRIPGQCGADIPSQVVPDNSVFVLGDNRGGSQDSRNLGAINEDDLVGRAFVVFWPRSDWQWL